MVQTILGLRADALNGKLYLAPTLPGWLPDITLQQLDVGPCTFDIHFWREGNRSRWEVVRSSAEPDTPAERLITVLEDPECPWLPR